ncbi:MAG: hypothetical protein IPI35_09315 [Deltaproteobacteria bacterium]|nr:hypothetical protein [Deltaproteobacteria bacterium]
MRALATLLLLAPLVSLASPAPSISPGRYALELVVATATQVPVMGETLVYTRSLSQVDVFVQDGVTYQTQRLCSVTVEDNNRLADTRIPEAFIKSFPVQTYAVSLTPLATGGVAYFADPGSVSIGFDPKRTAGQVPATPDDPNLLDYDGDGKPGATVNLVVPVLGAVELYIAQRGHSVMSGELQNGVVRGAVDVRYFSQRTLEASNSLFHANPPMRHLDESWFRLSPAPGMGCQQLSATLGARPIERSAP